MKSQYLYSYTDNGVFVIFGLDYLVWSLILQWIFYNLMVGPFCRQLREKIYYFSSNNFMGEIKLIVSN